MPKSKKILITTRTHEIYLVRSADNGKVNICPECGSPIAKGQPQMEGGKIIKHVPPITKSPERK